MSAKRATKPSPVSVRTVCSECGLDWALHGENPTTDDCIRLLKAELARRPVTVPCPTPVFPWRPWGETPRWPKGPYTITYGTPLRPETTTCRAIQGAYS